MTVPSSRISKVRHLQWAFSRRSCAAFLCLYFDLQTLLLVMRTLTTPSLTPATAPTLEGKAVAGLTSKNMADRIAIERSISGPPHTTGDALGRSPWFLGCG